MFNKGRTVMPNEERRRLFHVSYNLKLKVEERIQENEHLSFSFDSVTLTFPHISRSLLHEHVTEQLR